MAANPPEREPDNQPAPSSHAPKVDRSANVSADKSDVGGGALGSPDACANSDRYATETAHATPDSTGDEDQATVRK